MARRLRAVRLRLCGLPHLRGSAKLVHTIKCAELLLPFQLGTMP